MKQSSFPYLFYPRCLSLFRLVFLPSAFPHGWIWQGYGFKDVRAAECRSAIGAELPIRNSCVCGPLSLSAGARSHALQSRAEQKFYSRNDPCTKMFSFSWRREKQKQSPRLFGEPFSCIKLRTSLENLFCWHTFCCLSSLKSVFPLNVAFSLPLWRKKQPWKLIAYLFLQQCGISTVLPIVFKRSLLSCRMCFPPAALDNSPCVTMPKQLTDASKTAGSMKAAPVHRHMWEKAGWMCTTSYEKKNTHKDQNTRLGCASWKQRWVSALQTALTILPPLPAQQRMWGKPCSCGSKCPKGKIIHTDT